MRIFVIYHLINKDIYPEGYEPLLVGAALQNDIEQDDVTRDDSGEDNISEYNNGYCELTGLYWIWKYVIDEIVGLAHYRRFFLEIDSRERKRFRDDFYLKHPTDTKICHIMRKQEAEKHLKQYDILVKMSRNFHWNIREKLLDCIDEECLDNLQTIMSQMYPEVSEAFSRYLFRHSHILFNMFIGKKHIVDEYCEWLFPLLQKIDDFHVTKTGNRYHNREIGYLGEILFGFWLDQNCIKYKEVDALIPGKSKIDMVDGVTIDGGTNIYYRGELWRDLIHRIYRYFKLMMTQLIHT